MATISETEMIQRLNAVFPGRTATELWAIFNVIRDNSAATDSLAGTLTATAAELNILAGATLSTAELNTLDSPTLTTGAGAGITGGTGTVYKNSVRKVGGIIYTNILLDLTGLSSSTTDLDVIGHDAATDLAAHIGQITAAQNGTILGGRVTCLETPATGVVDIDLYAATVGTAVFDDGIAALTETALLTRGASWAEGDIKILTGIPAANGYLYLVNGAAGTVGTYTAGKFLIELQGYEA